MAVSCAVTRPDLAGIELSSADAGNGWLIFALPTAEVAAHPTADAGHHELYLMCDDIHATAGPVGSG